MTLTPGTRVGPYEVTAQIGVGGMGEVYRATDTNLKRAVAIKVLPELVASDADRLARFRREAEVLASLNHPNIAQIHGLEKSDGIIALVMELVEGPTLAERLAQGAIPLDEALPIAKQIAEALEAAHEQGIIHRDLKPANIKVRPDGVVKVLDFGLAKLSGPNDPNDPNGFSNSPTLSLAATRMGVILGTAAYMSPEQARGKAVDRRADIWAFGGVLYEMLTGRAPFPGDDVSQTLARVIDREPDWSALPPAVGPVLAIFLRRCLEKDPKRRVGDIRDVRLALEGAFETEVGQVPRLVRRSLGEDGSGPADGAGSAGAIGPDPAYVRSMRRCVLLVGAVTAIAGGAIVGASVWYAMRPPPPPLMRVEITTSGTSALRLHGNDPDLAITPDGSRIVYRGENQLLVRALNQLEPTALTGLGAPRGVFVSPDGQWVGFFEGNGLKKVALTGGPPVTLTVADGAGSRGATWGEDGTIVFATNSFTTGLQRVSAAGGEPTVLTKPNREGGENDHLWPEFLPGGQAVLFTITPGGGSLDNAQIAVLDLRTNTQAVLVRGGHHAHYVPSGHLVYGAGGTLRAVAFDLARLAVVGTPVPVLEQVTTTGTGGVDAVVATNGTLVYVAGSGIAGRSGHSSG